MRTYLGSGHPRPLTATVVSCNSLTLPAPPPHPRISEPSIAPHPPAVSFTTLPYPSMSLRGPVFAHLMKVAIKLIAHPDSRISLSSLAPRLINATVFYATKRHTLPTFASGNVTGTRVSISCLAIKQKRRSNRHPPEHCSVARRFVQAVTHCF